MLDAERFGSCDLIIIPFCARFGAAQIDDRLDAIERFQLADARWTWLIGAIGLPRDDRVDVAFILNCNKISAQETCSDKDQEAGQAHAV